MPCLVLPFKTFHSFKQIICKIIRNCIHRIIVQYEKGQFSLNAQLVRIYVFLFRPMWESRSYVNDSLVAVDVYLYVSPLQIFSNAQENLKNFMYENERVELWWWIINVSLNPQTIQTKTGWNLYCATELHIVLYILLLKYKSD